MLENIRTKSFYEIFLLNDKCPYWFKFRISFFTFSNFQIKQITFIFHQFYFTETVTFCFLKFNQMLFCWYWKTNRTLIFNSGNTKHIQTNTNTYKFHIQNPTIYIFLENKRRERNKYLYIFIVLVKLHFK